MWPFNKEKKAEPRAFVVPREKLMELAQKYDAFQKASGPAKSERLALWCFIEKIFPEVAVGEWYINFKTSLHVEITEGKRPNSW